MSPLRPEIYSMTLATHKIPQEGSSPTSSSRQGQLCNQTMLLRALTSQAMKKLLRMKTEQPVHYFPSHGEKVSSYILPELSLFLFMPTVSHPYTTQHCEEPRSILLVPFSQVLRENYQVPPETFSFPGSTRPISSVFPHREHAPEYQKL